MTDFVYANDFQFSESSTLRFFHQFLKGMVHKQNNLIGVIRGFSSPVLFDEGLDEGGRENLDQVQQSALTFQNLNEKVLSAAGIGRCDDGTVSLSQMLPFWTEKIETHASASNTAVNWAVSDDMSPVRGDNTKLTQILMELIKNATDAATGEGSHAVGIEISPSTDFPSATAITIRNPTVQSYTSTQLETLFRPFETQKSGEHFGLGLTLAAVLSAQMDFKLAIQSADQTFAARLILPNA